MVAIRQRLVPNAEQIYDGVNLCTSITVHETGNHDVGADAEAHGELQAKGNVRQASWHYTADDKEIVQSYLDTAQCWHGGTAEANHNSIAVEICVNKDGNYTKAVANVAWLVARLMAKHRLTIDDVVTHEHWTGKKCPEVMLNTNRWMAFLAAVRENQKKNQAEGGLPAVSKMVSPFQGRVTAEWRGYKSHAGIDIAPPKPGQTGLPVYAAFAGTVKAVHRTAKHGNTSSTWAPYRTGNGVLVANPDGEGNGYNHMTPVASLKVGDKGVAGQLSGHNDTSGTQTGPHLHFEMWADWEDPNSDYNPRLAFDRFKIEPGSAPKGTVTVTPVQSKPNSKPKPTKTITQMAKEVIAGKHGTGHEARRKSLGVSAATYEKVRAEVNRLASGTSKPNPKPSKTITQMAREVIAGMHGTGHEARRKSLGVSAATYAKVRAEVNRLAGAKPGKSISQMATEVLQGKHGTGNAARQKSLGIDSATYAKVRAEVNRRA